MNNYEISRDRAQAYFLGFDQEELIRKWDLQHDENALYVTFFGKPYRIDRSTGKITNSGQQAGFEEVLSIFDLLCHQGEKTASGRYAPVNSLKNAPKAGGVVTKFHTRFEALVDANPEAFCRACFALGGERVQMGDISFRFSVFADLTLILKFYHSDEDFPAQLTFLWDENTLQYLLYETVFYAAGFLAESIQQEMEKAPR